MQPWLTDYSHAQTLLSALDQAAFTGSSIVLNVQASIDIWAGPGENVGFVATGLKPRKKTWSQVKLVLRRLSISVSLVHKSFAVEPIPPPAAFEVQLDRKAPVLKPGPLFIAAARLSAEDNARGGTRPSGTDVFNGRIDSLTIKSCDQRPSVLAKYEFSLDISSDRIVDVSGRDHHGVLINAPTRAVKGHGWDGSECDWTRAKFGYGAIRFHDDDLDDAEWDTDFTIAVPPGARSGVYAVQVDAVNGRDTDSIVFFARPTR